jgi:hypothetical protein
VQLVHAHDEYDERCWQNQRGLVWITARPPLGENRASHPKNPVVKCNLSSILSNLAGPGDT